MVHNLFIAIIEQSFSSLRDNKPVQGDESSDEEMPQGSMSPKQIALIDMSSKSKK